MSYDRSVTLRCDGKDAGGCQEIAPPDLGAATVREARAAARGQDWYALGLRGGRDYCSRDCWLSSFHRD